MRFDTERAVTHRTTERERSTDSVAADDPQPRPVPLRLQDCGLPLTGQIIEAVRVE